MTDHPRQIDRFEVLDVLGKGAQGIVYRARDPQLQREVAIKAVRLQSSRESDATIDNLLQEARTVSQMQHANIVSIYDIGNDPLDPYLVLEYIEGQTLQQRLQSPPDLGEALQIMRDVLSGVAAAHERGIIHCDLKPANIMITGDGQAKVADFGLATLVDQATEDGEHLAGTPQYMAPEYIETRQRQTVSDVFSIGLIFYQLLTGRLAVDGEDVYQLLYAIANQPIEPPSKFNARIDERLDALIMKALEKNPESRFRNAGEMLQQLESDLALGEALEQGGDSDATVQFLLRRMKHKKDFPAFSQTISVLNRVSTSQTESLATVSNAILKDVSLTNKLLRIVNSAYYNRGGEKISTISRAVIMLGIEPIKSLALSLMLFEHLQNRQQAQELKEDAVSSLFSAIIADELARQAGIQSHEEAFLCALLQQLGKLLTRFYLHEEAQAIDRQVQSKGIEEETAALAVLGVHYHQLGQAVAREWGFPKQIIDSMSPIDAEQLKSRGDRIDRLRIIANFSNRLTDALKQPSARQEEKIETLVEQYGKTLALDRSATDALIERSQQELSAFAKLIRFNIEKSRFYQRLEGTTGLTAEIPALPSDPQQLEVLRQSMNDNPGDDNSVQALGNGIQDITNTLTGDFTINQVMQMVLETIYRALPGSRVLLGLRDPRSQSIVGKFGYGDDIENLIRNFSIPLAYQPDVFHIAFKNNVDIKIDDARDPKITDKVPEWYKRKVNSRFFIIFPIVIKHSPIALLYIDSADQAPIPISDEQLGLLKTLRNQVILAIKTHG